MISLPTWFFMISNFLPSAGPSVEVYNRGLNPAKVNEKLE
jgi:hypothetical protein